MKNKSLSIIAFVLSIPFMVNAQTDSFRFKGKIGKTLAESKEWWPSESKAPKGAPNIIIILLDDVGFGASSAFGGLVRTPNLDSLANHGLRYTNFHTTAICAPSRAALLTGRNSAYVHMSGFAHTKWSAGFPGWDGRIPSSAGTLAEILRENGYNTFAVGKWGLTPDEEASDAGPFDHWPSGKGFEHFFGFLGSSTDQYKPDLVEDNAHIKPDGRHLNAQITDKALSYIERQKKAAPDKPFFLYYAPGATHAPHQVDTFWSNQYRGVFDEGWDVYREKVFANQKRLGLLPANAQLPPRDEHITAWKDLTPQEQKLYARFFEVYAGYFTYTDFEIGRLLNYLKANHLEENTLIYAIIGDNGASRGGTVYGKISPKLNNQNKNTPEEYLKKNEELIDLIGTPQAKTEYPLGWSQATNTPFKRWKADANAEGGTHNPLIIFYPKLITTPGIRNQYGHLNDILPTTLELTGISKPVYIKGIKQDSIQGTSLAFSIKDSLAASRHTVQYYYIWGTRAIYSNGWKASASHRPDIFDTDFSKGKKIPKYDFNKDKWSLYHIDKDFTEINDLSTKSPEKLKELQKLFDQQAEANHLYPLIDAYDTRNKLIHKNVQK